MSSFSSHSRYCDNADLWLGEAYEHSNAQIYVPTFQRSSAKRGVWSQRKRGQWNEIERFAKSAETAPAFGRIFPCTRSINICSEVSASGVSPYQVGEKLRATWADSSNRLDMEPRVGRCPPAMYPGDPATNIITDEFRRNNANQMCGRDTVAMGVHAAQWKTASTVPDKYGAQQDFEAKGMEHKRSIWDTPTRAMSISGVRRQGILSKCVSAPVQFPSSKQSRSTAFSPSTPRQSGQSLVPLSNASSMGAWGKRGNR